MQVVFKRFFCKKQKGIEVYVIFGYIWINTCVLQLSFNCDFTQL